MKKGTIILEDLSCPSCVQKIEAATKAIAGLKEETLTVLYNSGKVKFDFDDEQIEIKDVEKVITRMGFKVKKSQVKDL